jgi:predicted pyridoxine 5'-phosphate oxidase superfamily flavin-nucleotide-binding protein
MATLTGFHEGELAVQAKAGVGGQAARLAGMLAPPNLDGGAGRFLTMQSFAALTARDGDGVLWTSALVGTPGFLAGHGTTLRVHALPGPGDPLAGLPVGQPVGMVAIEFARRRRVRVNGTLSAAGPDGLTIDVEQAYGNCPQYINERTLTPNDQNAPADPTRAYDGTSLDTRQAGIITAANTFFLGTAHPTRGADSSHRGGPRGFVRVDHGDVWWPDYPGNNMFNSFGNIAVDPTASLLFVDFTTGTTLHLSGTATIEWTTSGAEGDDGHTGRRVHLTPKRVVRPSTPLPVHVI